MKAARIQGWRAWGRWAATRAACLAGWGLLALPVDSAWSQSPGSPAPATREAAPAGEAGGDTGSDRAPEKQELEDKQETQGTPQPEVKPRRTGRQEKPQGPNRMDSFMRIRKNERGKPVAMETSITRYETTNAAGEPVVVDLIGVVHIGEKAYYEQLNQHFEQYDGLLYELVAPEGTRIPEGGRSPGEGMNPLAAMQLGMKSMLELEFQLEHINYNRENFIHADMSPDEFLESMQKNDESFGKMFLKAIGTSLASENRPQVNNGDLLAAMFSKNPSLKLRRAMAQQMRDMEGGMAIFEGREGSTIINHRNAKALEVMKREMANGKKKLAIFYGAGHLPDMERRLMSDFQMKRGGQFWLEAWKLAE